MPSPAHPRIAVALAAAAAAVLAVLTCLARQPGAPLDNLWAEDATRFLTNAYQTPLWRALALPYSGYLHLYPRLSGALAAALPPVDAARVLTLAGCIATAAAMAAIVVSGRAVIGWLPARVAVAVAVPLLPLAASAAVDDVANAHVWLDLLALVLLFRPLATRSPAGGGDRRPAPRLRDLETAACWVAVVLAVGSDPQAVVLLPVAVARAVLTRRAGGPRVAAEIVTGVLLAVGGAVQLVTVATHQVPAAAVHPGPGTLGRLYLRDVAGSMLLGVRRSLDAGRPALLALAVALVAVVAVTLAASRARGAVALVLLVLSVALWAVPPWLKWTSRLGGHTGIEVEDSRYTVLSSAILLLVLAGCVDAWLARLRRPLLARVTVLALAVAVAAVLWAPSLRVGPVREPSWSAGIRAGEATCRAQPARRQVSVAAAPGTFNALVPCARLR